MSTYEEAAALLNGEEHSDSALDVRIQIPEITGSALQSETTAAPTSKHGDTLPAREFSLQISNIDLSADMTEQASSVISIEIAEKQNDKILQEPVQLVDNEINILNSQLLDAIIKHNNVDVERLLKEGASPNATCRENNNSACHVAACTNSEALSLLIKHNAIKDRRNNDGSTPLHLAAWAGDNRNIAMLLGISIDILQEDLRMMNGIIDLIPQITTTIVNDPCVIESFPEMEESWRDSQDHNCESFMGSVLKFKPEKNWTPLHIASYAGHNKSVRLLLAAGANPIIKDELGNTPLAIAGGASIFNQYKVDINSYMDTIKTLLEYRSTKLNPLETCPRDLGSALHVAVELGCEEAVQLLLDAGAPITQHNYRGNTPLHECVRTSNEQILQLLAQHTEPGQSFPSVDVTDHDNGYTVLQSAVLASWLPGVRIALDAGADVSHKAKDGYSTIHLAARKGNLEILKQILDVVYNVVDAVNDGNEDVETPLICAILSGNLGCVQELINKGAFLKIHPVPEHTLSEEDTSDIYHFFLEYIKQASCSSTRESWENIKRTMKVNNNLILHAIGIEHTSTAEVEFVNILNYLFDRNKSLCDLLDYRCTDSKNMIPLEIAAFQKNVHVFKLLLEKSIERAKAKGKKFDPTMLWFYFGAMVNTYGKNVFADKIFYEMLKTTILLYPATVQEMEKRNFHILHKAILCDNKEMILILIDNGADLSVRDDKNQTAMSLLIRLNHSVEFLEGYFDNCIQFYPDHMNEQDWDVGIVWRVLAPKVDYGSRECQMRVLKALVETGNYKGQKKLLMHPLVQSFLFIKWGYCLKYFYAITFLYTFFATSLSLLIVPVFYYKDQDQPLPSVCNPVIWNLIMHISLAAIVCQEIPFIHLPTKNCIKNWPSLETIIEYFVKCGSFFFGIVTPRIITMESELMEWWRYLATATLVLAWSNIMLLLSKTPTAGYYMQMFWSVSFKIVKILLTFSSLFIMFSLCFMVLFHTKAPFDGPLAALIKTLVMMTSEFEYEDNFAKVEANDVFVTVLILRLVFVIFLIITAIVLMNLMTGVAVSDTNELIYKGNLRRLDKQIEYLYALEASMKNKSCFHAFSLLNWLDINLVWEGGQSERHIFDFELRFNEQVRESIRNKAVEKTESERKKDEANKLEVTINEMVEAISKNNSKLDEVHEEINKQKSKLDQVINALLTEKIPSNR